MEENLGHSTMVRQPERVKSVNQTVDKTRKEAHEWGKYRSSVGARVNYVTPMVD